MTAKKPRKVQDIAQKEKAVLSDEEMKQKVLLVAQQLKKHPSTITYKDMWDVGGCSSYFIRKNFCPWGRRLAEWFGERDSVDEMRRAVWMAAKKLKKHPAMITCREMEKSGVCSKRQTNKFAPWKKTLEGWFGHPDKCVSDALDKITHKQETVPSSDVSAQYLAQLEEEEVFRTIRRWDKRVAQSLAKDMLVTRRLEEIVKRNIAGKLPSPIKPRLPEKKSRIVNLMLADLHIGADIDPLEFPEGYGLLQAGRRLGKITHEVVEYKKQYRDSQKLNVLLNGDIMQGELGHDREEDIDGAIQFGAALHFLIHCIRHLSLNYSTVDVWCQSGNHGRDINRHPKRALSHKWNSKETELYFALKAAFSLCGNVEFHIDRRQITVIPVFNQRIAMTHGDTALPLGPPRTRGALYEKAFEQLNGNLTLGERIHLLAVGHFHEPHYMIFKSGSAVVSGALVPPNGYARTLGYESLCGQWVWESVPGYAWGDSRYLNVGIEDDNNEKLDKIIPPFDW